MQDKSGQASNIRYSMSLMRGSSTSDNRTGVTPMRDLIWLVLALLLFLTWVGSYVVYQVAGILIHLLLVFALISITIYVLSKIGEPEQWD
jgi:hypothetical protein